MLAVLAFEHLVKALHEQLALLPDYRKGKHTHMPSKMPHWGRLPCALPIALVFGLSADDATDHRAEPRPESLWDGR